MPRLTGEAAAARKARIVEMRRTWRPFDQIGAEFGITGARAHQIYWEAVNERPTQQVEEHRAEQLELYDLATRRLMAIAMSTNPKMSARTQVEAWNAIRGFSEARRRLLGLDAPAQVQVNHQVDSDFDRAYAELLETMRERAAAAEDQDGLAAITSGGPEDG